MLRRPGESECHGLPAGTHPVKAAGPGTNDPPKQPVRMQGMCTPGGPGRVTVMILPQVHLRDVSDRQNETPRVAAVTTARRPQNKGNVRHSPTETLLRLLLPLNDQV